MKPFKNAEFHNVLETIFLFLKNNNLTETAKLLNKECNQNGIQLSNISGKVLYKCSHKGPIREKIRSADERIVLYTFLQKVENGEESDTVCESDDLRYQFQQLQEDYKTLLDVTFELTNLLQMNLAEQAKNVQLVLTQCEFLHPSLFKPVKITSGCRSDKISTSEKSDYINSEKKGVHSQEVDEQISITTPTVPLIPSSSPQNEVKYVLEQILENVVKLEANNQEYTSKNNIQEVRCLLEDILEKVIISPMEKHTEETICHKINENIVTTSENSLPIPLNSGEYKRNFLSMDQYSPGAKVKTSSQKMDAKLTCNTITEEGHLQEVPNLKIMDEVPRKRTKDQTKFKFSKSQKNALKFPQTPLCYLEVCRKLDDDSKNTCKCMKCLPQQNRYYCSCFDLICKDLEEKTEIIQTEHAPLLQKLQDQNQFEPSQNKPKRKVLGDVCDICREKKCNCAFKSRPKIGRSPPT